MASVYANVLTSEELEYLNSLPEVLAAKASLDTRSSGMVYFSVDITPGIRETLQARFGLDVTGDIPMRWIKGDTAPHIDRGASTFEQTFLVYLNDSPGEFVVDAQSYPIEANTGFSFTEGLSHKTQGTSDVPRLLLGPMNEFAEPVGAAVSTLFYYATETDALSSQNHLGSSTSFVVGAGGPYGGGITSWKLSTNSTGSSPTNAVYTNGDTLNSGVGIVYYYLYPSDSPPPAIVYYYNQADALNDTFPVRATSSFVVGSNAPTRLGVAYTTWKLSTRSTGTSDDTLVYSNPDELTSGVDSSYYLYPTPIPPMNYFNDQTDADNNRNPLTASLSFTIGEGADYNFSGLPIWRLAGNSTGSSSQLVTYNTGETLTGGVNAVYYLYPGTRYVFYFANETDALNNTNPTESTYSFVVVGNNGFTRWRLASTSTGSSSQLVVYNEGDELTGGENAVYYLYGVTPYVFYYANETDALNNTNSTASTYSFVVDGLGGVTSWRLASTSTGSSSQEVVYNEGDELTSGDNVVYYLYPVDSPPPSMFYYANEADALADQNLLGSSDSFVVGADGPYGPGSGYTLWRLAENSTGESSQLVEYSNGDELTGGENAVYYLYPNPPPPPCFLEGSLILCQVDGVDSYVPVEQLTKGTLVKTSLHGYKPLVLIGKGTIENPGNDERIEQRLYKCSPSKYPQMTKNLFLTGCHSILVSTLTDKQREDTINHLGKVFVTDKKYRLMACVDERAEPWISEGTYTIWHFALDHENDLMNYGVYANGLLVESCGIRTLKNNTKMTVS